MSTATDGPRAAHARADEPAFECLCPLVHSTPGGWDYCRAACTPGSHVCPRCESCDVAPMVIPATDVIPATELVTGDYLIATGEDGLPTGVMLVDSVSVGGSGTRYVGGRYLDDDEPGMRFLAPWALVMIAYDRETIGDVR